MNDTAQDYSQYSPTWQFRFDFYDRYGEPKSSTFKTAMRSSALSFGQKVKLNMNFYAFFFGFIYFFILGMWRKALVLIGASFVIGFICSFLPDYALRSFGLAYSLLVGMTANYAYYLHKIKGSTSWNPLEGVRW
ncbi:MULTISPECIES: DUF2628 domain-containing protein [Pseudomonadota]|uniref:DUF2628 domain-containing protein n=1 Tax=Pseudomonadota TaxID=1224 RepID=UPI0006E63749|nr:MULTISPECIES: DUF2628 domain-containing protein [Pseudomonadota]MBO9749346.1 DUF2628 domain-containing protein [Xanthomonas phaseoli pv. dieffenbachiae]MBO9753388.1 DUF2628 domain-containing protein [Xanthomonas phaseoli pv. dieffenbachiae]MBO9831185.1 DUF2628 domain-containing protein [Xanthomonas phaseoli pv. dieffenbachiae]MBO9837520.1 DUF2628 domain-containing protein [Xanthomonas phaseoli pv. dieffenbachiae]MBO9839240.1 DUF2628 domain-containing protein [Xanthomonas phaseoli pv. dieffe